MEQAVPEDVLSTRPLEPFMISRIVATGRCVPENLVTNETIESELGLEQGWIVERTGVHSRSIASAEQAVSDLAIIAGQSALQQFEQLDCPRIGTLILATSTPDYLLPPTAPYIATELGLSGVGAMDLAGACCGFLYGLQLADALAKSSGQSVMLVAGNILSRRVQPEDIATRALFADAAGAVILAPADDSAAGVLGHCTSSNGQHWKQLLIPDGGSRNPFSESSFDVQSHLMQMNSGNLVFRHAVESMGSMGNQVLQELGLQISEIDWWVPHQANMRIIEATRRILKMDRDKTIVTADCFGNSSAASIPVTLDWAIKDQNQIKPGQTVLFTAAGAGMTSAASVVTI